MDGNTETIMRQLLSYGREISAQYKIYPYVSFVVKNGVVVARGHNETFRGFDVSMQDMVSTIRKAQDAIESGELSGYTLYSYFEPTITGFDVALWSGITDFVWSIQAKSMPEVYTKIAYSPSDYALAHPDKITLASGILEEEAISFVRSLSNQNYWSVS